MFYNDTCLFTSCIVCSVELKRKYGRVSGRWFGYFTHSFLLYFFYSERKIFHFNWYQMCHVINYTYTSKMLKH